MPQAMLQNIPLNTMKGAGYPSAGTCCNHLLLDWTVLSRERKQNPTLDQFYHYEVMAINILQGLFSVTGLC